MAISFEPNRQYNLHIRNFGTNRDGFFDIIAKGGVTVVWSYDADIDEVQIQVGICRPDEMYSRRLGREAASAMTPVIFPARKLLQQAFEDSGFDEVFLRISEDLEDLPLDLVVSRTAVEDLIIDHIRTLFLTHYQKTNPDVETMGVYIPSTI